MTDKIFVTRPFLPPVEEYLAYVKKIYETGILTGQAVSGPLGQELERRLSSFLKVENFQIVTNGTIALQFALKALGIESGEVITTPFTYVATTSSILWERCKPVFVDIEPDNFTLDPTKIEAAITPNTRAIMPVHVFGYACDVDAIQKIADKHGLKVIYDAAHAFGSVYKGKSLTSYGDVSTLSFQATKIFHTAEGGACICRDRAVHERLDQAKHFGLNGTEHVCLGINGKQEEFNAALGLAVFDHMNEIFKAREHICAVYDELLKNKVQRPKPQKDLIFNHAYYPVLFENEKELLAAFDRWNKADIFPRRYFHPSLTELPYLTEKFDCPVSKDVSSRIVSMPLYVGMTDDDVERVCKEI